MHHSRRRRRHDHVGTGPGPDHGATCRLGRAGADVPARSEHPAVVLGDEIVVAGGLIEVGVGRTGVTPTVEAYSPETDTWRDLPPLPEARHHGMAAAVGEQMFFMGGYTARLTNPSTDVWELVEEAWVMVLPFPLRWQPALP